MGECGTSLKKVETWVDDFMHWLTPSHPPNNPYLGFLSGKNVPTVVISLLIPRSSHDWDYCSSS